MRLPDNKCHFCNKQLKGIQFMTLKMCYTCKIDFYFEGETNLLYKVVYHFGGVGWLLNTLNKRARKDVHTRR